MVEVVHSAEQRLEAVLLWVDQLLATKDLLEQDEVVVLLWVLLLGNQRGLKHLERCSLCLCELTNIWLNAERASSATKTSLE